MEEERKGHRIYKTIMLMIITALITALITTIVIYRNISGITSIESIASSADYDGLELTLARIRTILEEEYIGTIDDEAMLESAIKGYIEGLGDEYAAYYTAEEMEEQLETTNGNYVGIGIYMIINYEEGTITVVEPIEGSPAEEVGLKEGDIITKVDGEEVTVDNVSTMTDKIKGEEGTTVELEIQRDDETFTVVIERQTVTVSHIDSQMLEDNIGYISITDFEGGTADEFYENYEELVSQGAESLVIDIRNNTGGLVDEAIAILEMLCNKGDTLLITENKSGEEEITISEEEQTISMPVVLLVNEYSASASEIVAGALKDNNRADIVGITTYGKGVIQTLMQLSDGSGLKITTEEYYTPNHNEINKVGIEPDCEVELPEDIEELLGDDDTQLQKAIELLQTN